MTRWLTEDEHRAWRGFLRLHAQLTAALAQSLKADSDMSVPDYEVLAILSEAPQGALQALDLRRELQWEKSRLAHHIRRMEQRGFVRREACASDARAPIVRITDVGLAVIRAAAPAHVAHVRELFVDPLTPQQVEMLGQAAEAILKNLARLERNAGPRRVAEQGRC